ncbi:glutathione S-transferase family protein [Ramlibacter sp. RBP-2]|uniref:Glutathione S-transferase family protein n=1 Tax=Ramlibacter lithotrophicus TaxID=2606681 RepID=A0A7X6DEB9_9BURK|nr:glutathione S-transferase C-terminal domain-containing protein [Ramlibacter lithotrophicus]NKE65615.1 glutathione S-transferase family protein [Ramlibacter lithotrophicus]
MGLVLFELRAAGGRAFSPYCWRARMALAHKELTPELRPARFTDIPRIGHGAKSLPVLLDGPIAILDSWDIALYLEERYPQAPSLFGGAAGRQFARFVHHWATTQLHPPIVRIGVADIWERLDAADQPYFRETREQRLGAPLESFRAQQPALLAQLGAALAPMRAMLVERPFLGGDQPSYADYVVFGAFQWSRVICPVPLLAADDAVQQWFERCLDLHGGLGRRAPAGG